MNLYLLQYNNYYNRILKREETYADYKTASNFPPILGIQNFSYADGISTQQTANIPDDVVQGYGMPDYALAVDDNMNILYRYFVIDAVFKCKGQYVLTLYRDLIADFYNDVVSAPVFVEKGPLADTDPFIYNKEDMTFNQVKKQEIYLQDKFHSPWIVGYMTNKNPESDDTEYPNGNYSFTFKRKIQPDYTIDSQENFASITGVSLGANTYMTRYAYQVQGSTAGSASHKYWIMSFNDEGAQPIEWNDGATVGFAQKTGSAYASNLSLYTYKTQTKINTLLNYYISSIGGGAENKLFLSGIYGYGTYEDYWNAQNVKDKIVYVSSEGKYYQIKVDNHLVWDTKDIAIETDIYQKLDAITESAQDDKVIKTIYSGTAGSGSYKACVEYKRATVSLVAYNGVPVEPIEVNIPAGRNVLQDAPYCMFAIPFYDNRRFYRNGIYSFGTMGPEMALNFVSDMSAGLSGANILWDIQLLPYSPFPSRIQGNEGIMDISGMAENADYQFIEIDETYHTGIPIFWCQQSTFSFNIEYEIYNPFQKVEIAGTVYNEGKPAPKKIWNEVMSYRLCSPNYSSGFEFSASKNNGVGAFNVDCTYKPFQPYIHINPNFGGLYGSDFDDARGLICGGDFSLSQLNDAWETYQRQNINYEKSFQRQIENMEINQKYQRMEDIISASLGTITGAGAGVALGKAGGPAGMIAGGIIGGGLSMLAGIADVNINDKLRAEAMDFTKDNFGYSLGNIQALPTTISKVSAFTANNKIYPILEIYSATDQEIEALCYKLGYNGMTVMRIGTLNDFIINKIDFGKYAPTGKNYFKGKLINLIFEDGYTEDYHIINALSAELDKGIYI